MVEHEFKEVFFHEFCKQCKHYKEEYSYESPCEECLDNPVNLHTHRPVKFEDKSPN